jgi:N utilization substance protein B
MSRHDWQESLAIHAEATEASDRVIAMASSIVDGVLTSLESVDDLIVKYAPMWPLEQMSPVDRNVLRLSLFELMLGSGVPPKVVINEAVELAKEFGGAGSPRFVNGVLGAALAGLGE